MEEQWRAIPDFPGYEVSDQGRVRSYWKRGWRPRRGSAEREYYCETTQQPRIMKQNLSPWGRPEIKLMRNAKQRRYFVHRLVMLAFAGPCPDGMEVAHIDGNSQNNHLSNLCYQTHAENMLNRLPYTRGGCLTPQDAIDIRNKRAGGVSLRTLAREYSRSVPCISQISRGVTFPDIGGPLTHGASSVTRNGRQ